EFGKLHARLRLRIARRGREPVADRIGADDEVFFGIERLARPDHEVDTVMIAADRRHHQDGVGFLRIQRAVGDVGDREILDRLAAFELEVTFAEGLVWRLLRRVRRCRQQEKQAGHKAGDTCDRLHLFPPIESERVDRALMHGRIRRADGAARAAPRNLAMATGGIIRTARGYARLYRRGGRGKYRQAACPLAGTYPLDCIALPPSIQQLTATPLRDSIRNDRTLRVGLGAEPRMVEKLSRQRVLNFLDVFYSGDLEDALGRCSDDIVLIAPAPIDVLPHMGRRHGKDEVRKTWQTVHARYSSMR